MAVVDRLLRQLIQNIIYIFIEIAAKIGYVLRKHLAECVDRHCLDILFFLLPLRVLLVLLLGLDDLALQGMILHD